MTQPEKQRKLSEAAGWKQCDPVKYEADDLWHMKGHGFALGPTLPDFFGDLNACAELEKTLDASQRTDYIGHLIRATGHQSTFATSEQRAEALGLALRLWNQ